MLTALVAAIVVLGRYACVAQANVTASSPSENSWLDGSQKAEIDRLFARPPNSPGYAVAVIKDGAFALAHGYGLANLDDGIPITPRRLFIWRRCRSSLQPLPLRC